MSWFDRDRSTPQHHHSNPSPKEEGAVVSLSTDPIRRVQIDAVVFLQIMKHCRQHAPTLVTGTLLGLDVDDTLGVTHCFAHSNPSDESNEEREQHQSDTLKCLRKVNVDSHIVGWYQTTHLGQFFSSQVLNNQNWYQTEIPRSILLTYDALQSSIGKPAFKAWQLTADFMAAYSETTEAGKAALAEFPSNDMFMEIPISIHSSAIAEAFLVDWAISDPISTTSQVDILDVENQAFLEKNVQLLMESLQNLAEEQNRLLLYERQANRKAEPMKGGRNFRQNPQQPRQLDTMILSQQIKNYCKAINSFATDAFGKIYLVANKPSGGGTD